MNHRKLFFDSIASDWDKDYTEESKRKDVDSLISKFGIEKGDKVLDLGCGTGIITGRVLNAVGEKGKVVGCDFSLKMLANSSLSNDNFVCCDVYHLPFKDSYFDKAIFFSCFPHFQNKPLIIKEISRVLRKKGVFFISHLLSSEEIKAVHENVDKAVCLDFMPEEEKMKRMFQEAGLEVLDFIDRQGFYFCKVKK